MGRPPGILTSAEEDDAEQHTNKDPSFSNAVTPAKAPDEKRGIEARPNKRPIFEVEGWPYQEIGASFRIRAKGNFDMPVYKSPSLDISPEGVLKTNKNEEIGWVSSLVSVLRPARFRAKKEVLVEGTRFTETYLDGDEHFSKTLKKGENLEMLLYVGNGLCYLKTDSVIFEGLCPSSEAFTGRFVGRDAREQMQARERIWWIELEGGRGWITVDDHFIIEIY